MLGSNDDGVCYAMSSAREEVDYLYRLLELRAKAIQDRFGHMPTPRDLSKNLNGGGTPGVYFFFEPDERREDPEAERIVRIGSHQNEELNIESRVLEHAKDWGRSVFRRHVGTALIRKGAFDAAIQRSDRDRWASEWYSSIDRCPVHCNPSRLDPTLHPLHPLVTRTISDMHVLWVEIAKREHRLEFERECISLLSNRLRQSEPIDPPSKHWLGLYARNEKVRKSGLWNVLHVKRTHTPGFLKRFEKYFR